MRTNKLFTTRARSVFVKFQYKLIRKPIIRSLESTSKANEDTNKSVGEYSKDRKWKNKKSICSNLMKSLRDKTELTKSMGKWHETVIQTTIESTKWNGRSIMILAPSNTRKWTGSSGIFADFFIRILNYFSKKHNSNRIGELYK